MDSWKTCCSTNPAMLANGVLAIRVSFSACVVGVATLWACFAADVVGAAAENPSSAVHSVRQDEPVAPPQLEWKLQAGQSLQVEIRQSSSTEIDVAGNKTLQPGGRRLLMTWEVLAADDAQVQVRMRWRQIDFEVATPAGKVALSTDPSQPKIGDGKATPLLKALAGRLQALLEFSVDVRFDRTGRLIEVSLPDGLVAFLQAESSTPLRGWLSEEGLRQMLGAVLAPLPESPQVMWEDQRTLHVAAGVPLTQTTRYVLGVQQPPQSIVVNFQTELSFPESYLVGPTRPADPEASQAVDPNPPRGAEPPFDFDPTSQKWPRIARQNAGGNYVFDYERGYVTSASMQTLLATEKAYSDSLIKVTITTQTEVEMKLESPGP